MEFIRLLNDEQFMLSLNDYVLESNSYEYYTPVNICLVLYELI